MQFVITTRLKEFISMGSLTWLESSISVSHTCMRNQHNTTATDVTVTWFVLFISERRSHTCCHGLFFTTRASVVQSKHAINPTLQTYCVPCSFNVWIQKHNLICPYLHYSFCSVSSHCMDLYCPCVDSYCPIILSIVLWFIVELACLLYTRTIYSFLQVHHRMQLYN